MDESLSLTRYLYNKKKVFQKLSISIAENNYDESLFWAYELYFSWLSIETIDYLFEILEMRLPQYKCIYKFLFKKKMQWLQLDICEKPHNIIATIIKNILIRNPNIPEPDYQYYFTISMKDIESYKTMHITPVYRTLSTVCKYNLVDTDYKIDITQEQREILTDFCDNWLYYASKIPLWEYRISQYNGEVDPIAKKITFENDDFLEEFFDKYGFEPYEQTIEIQRRLTGI